MNIMKLSPSDEDLLQRLEEEQTPTKKEKKEGIMNIMTLSPSDEDLIQRLEEEQDNETLWHTIVTKM